MLPETLLPGKWGRSQRAHTVVATPRSNRFMECADTATTARGPANTRPCLHSELASRRDPLIIYRRREGAAEKSRREAADLRCLLTLSLQSVTQGL